MAVIYFKKASSHLQKIEYFDNKVGLDIKRLDRIQSTLTLIVNEEQTIL